MVPAVFGEDGKQSTLLVDQMKGVFEKDIGVVREADLDGLIGKVECVEFERCLSTGLFQVLAQQLLKPRRNAMKDHSRSLTDKESVDRFLTRAYGEGSCFV